MNKQDYGLDEQDSYKDKKVLRRLYWDEWLPQSTIAGIFDVDQANISYWMDKVGVPTRNDRLSNETHGRYSKKIRENSNGYLVTPAPDSQYLYIHRLVAVSEFGFDEVKDKEVHHKNGCPLDNRPENLEPVTQAEHNKIHKTNNE